MSWVIECSVCGSFCHLESYNEMYSGSIGLDVSVYKCINCGSKLVQEVSNVL